MGPFRFSAITSSIVVRLSFRVGSSGIGFLYAALAIDDFLRFDRGADVRLDRLGDMADLSAQPAPERLTLFGCHAAVRQSVCALAQIVPRERLGLGIIAVDKRFDIFQRIRPMAEGLDVDVGFFWRPAELRFLNAATNIPVRRTP